MIPKIKLLITDLLTDLQNLKIFSCAVQYYY